MAERASLRVYFRYMRSLNSDHLFEVDDFILGCHARIEDEVVFPVLRNAGSETSGVTTLTSKLEEEHRVLQMLSNRMRATVLQKTTPLDGDIIALYASTVGSHNSAEETTVFKYWDQVDSESRAECTSQVRRIVGEFGAARYLRVTCFSQEFLSLLA